MNTFDIEKPLLYPLRLTIPLPFPDADVKAYPWLNKGDRYYKLVEELDSGGYSKAFRGFPCDSEGFDIPDAAPVVVKIPNLHGNHTSAETLSRLVYIQSRTIEEWGLIRLKLLNCRHANPIFDIGTVYSQSPFMEMFVTVQPYLATAVPLKQWLVDHNLRPKISLDETTGKEIHDWKGLSDWTDWLTIATLIGAGLLEIHRCRVIHGDVWPPNIYIDASSMIAIFIDFGESFGATPTGDPRLQRNHEYRAPERGRMEYVPTEQVDVYSFGKLLLYLTIGQDREIPRREKPDGQLLYGHQRRAFVRTLVLEGNRHLVSAHPEILDIIAQCTALDPVDRPSMEEICDQLHRLSPARTSTSGGIDISSRLQQLTDRSKTHRPQISNVFGRFIDRKVEELERLMESCQTEMVEVRGTRDSLINSLVSLFTELGEGDSWTTLTTPSVWQEYALGLDGRYATASINAVRRKAAIHRTHAVSVEELGTEWARTFMKNLEATKLEELVRLARAFDTAIKEFEYHKSAAEDYKARSDQYIQAHQERFTSVLESLDNTIKCWGISSFVYRDKFVTIKDTPGLYLGLVPVGTLSKIREKRTENPVSALYIARETRDHDKWLLVMTDIRGRNEYDASAMTWPQLLGVRVYKSVKGVPGDRLLGLERLMANESVNIGHLTEQLMKCARQAGK